MKLREILTESVNDKGIFKAVFLAGLPGTGKSTIIERITDGTIAPRLINTDRSYEFLLRKHGQEASNVAWQLLGQESKSINMEALSHYINGMLPLFIDSTSADIKSAMRRVSILESLGYDVSAIWVNTDVETAIERINQRDRKVDPEFIQKVHSTVDANKTLYQQMFKNFTEVDNNADNFSQMESSVYNKTNQFFNSSIQNTTGNRIYQQLTDSTEKYLVPSVYTKEHLDNVVSTWYVR